MSIESGQGSPPTANPDGTREADLQAQLKTVTDKLAESEVTINRLRGTQSSNDRTIAEQKSRMEVYAAQTSDMEAQLKAVSTDFGIAKTTIEQLTQQVGDFSVMSKSIETLQTQNNRLLIAASKAQQSPIIGALINNNALPTAETAEEFEAALDNIIAGAKEYAQIQVQSTLSGARPNPGAAGTGSESPEDMIRRGQDMMRHHNIDEGLNLIRRASEIKANTS